LVLGSANVGEVSFSERVSYVLETDMRAEYVAPIFWKELDSGPEMILTDVLFSRSQGLPDQVRLLSKSHPGRSSCLLVNTLKLAANRFLERGYCTSNHVPQVVDTNKPRIPSAPSTRRT
jgi:hypothetical protein